jgi:hypothetical protein
MIDAAKNKAEALARNPNLFILPNGEILRLSPSRILNLQSCPRMFRADLLKESRDPGSINTEVGTAVHWVLENLNKGADWTPKERINQLRLKLIELCSELGIPVSFPKAYELSMELIENYSPPPGHTLVSAEGKRVIEFAEYQFSYIVDAVWSRVDENGVKYLSGRDYKSGQRPKTHMQGTLYLWALYHDFPKYRDHKLEFAYHMTQDDKLIWVNAENVVESMDEFMTNAIQQIKMSFMLDHFPATPSNDACRFCPVATCAVKHGMEAWG